jgi:hypothetical protein
MNTADNELLRHVVLETLVTRHPAALPMPALKRKAQPELGREVKDEELESALLVLSGKGLVKSHYDELGSSTWWQATGEGVLFHERR